MPVRKILRYVAFLMLLSLLYWLCVQLGLSLHRLYHGFTPIWPASGLGVALLWRYGYRWIPAIVIGRLLTGFSIHGADQFFLLGVQVLGDVGEASLAANLLSRFKADPWLCSIRDLLIFVIAGCLIPSIVSAVLGVVAMLQIGMITNTTVAYEFLQWWLSDVIGILIITPFIVHWWRWPVLARKDVNNWLLSMLLLVVSNTLIVIFFHNNGDNLVFLLLPVIVLAAVWSGQAGASSAAVLLTVLVIVLNETNSTTDFSAMVRLAFVGTSIFTSLLVAAALSERRKIGLQLNREYDRALVTLQSIGDGVIVTDARGRVDFINPVAEKITGHLASSAIGKPVAKILVFSPTPARHPVKQCLDNTETKPVNTRSSIQQQDGRILTVDNSISPVLDRHGVTLGAVVVFRDDSEQERLRRELVHEATHDALTGLRNRASFDVRLRELTMDGDPSMQHALLYLDLDQFKLINDTRGHAIGDKLLADIGNYLQAFIPQDQLLARLGGDEFAVLMLHSDAQNAMAMAEKIRRTILDYRYREDMMSLAIGVSIGVTTFKPGEMADEVLSRADIACYSAKEAGHNSIHLYRPDDTLMLKRHADITRLSRLRHAIDNNHFRLFIQKITPIREESDAVENFSEVLLRLKENSHLIMPEDFFPIAIRYGFSPLIDHWVITQVFKYLGTTSPHSGHMSINLGAMTLDSADFPDLIFDLSTRYRIDPARICFEVTETVAINNLTRAVEVMRMLSKQGFRFALDDFGTGIANFSYFQDIPVDYVKIDGRFVKHLQDDPSNTVIIRSLVELAHMRGIQCIAEWVESKEILDTLATLGVDYAQGFYIHKPEPLA